MSPLPEPGSIEQMLDDMPQNRCLYRDSGLWSICDEGLNVVFYKQGVNETFHDFVKRAYEDDNVYKDAFAQGIEVESPERVPERGLGTDSPVAEERSDAPKNNEEQSEDAALPDGRRTNNQNRTNMKTAIELIAEERAEQVTKHGFDAAHDDEHRHGEIALHAASLACVGTDYSVRENNFPEREHPDDWGLREKIGIDRIKALTVAGALIAAELDRHLRELATPLPTPPTN